ncbi:YlzJ-like family protein [Virgibacillus kekensis]|uniref:YlzJ-like family protein n=1 Tax=Virgibacillus kekensis TaxID=202261 RepID=A0ABV9DH95_9BACI
MILYTPLSPNDIFPSEEKDFNNRQCVNYNGKQLYVEQTEDGGYRLLQLLSTDPQDFMNSDYNPGTILKD